MNKNIEAKWNGKEGKKVIFQAKIGEKQRDNERDGRGNKAFRGKRTRMEEKKEKGEFLSLLKG